MRPAVRLAALMKLPVTYVWTHDSIGLGEDGPTHQPVEHLAALRAIPGPRRGPARPTPTRPRSPGGPILEHTDRPAGLALTRQNLPIWDRDGLRLGRGHRAGRLRARRRLRRPARRSSSSPPAPRCSSPSRPASGSRPRAPRPGSCRCRAWSGSASRTRPTSSRCCPRGVKARVSVEAGIAHGLARRRRRRRRDRQPRALRRQRRRTRCSSSSSGSRPTGSWPPPTRRSNASASSPAARPATRPTPTEGATP